MPLLYKIIFQYSFFLTVKVKQEYKQVAIIFRWFDNYTYFLESDVMFYLHIFVFISSIYQPFWKAILCLSLLMDLLSLIWYINCFKQCMYIGPWNQPIKYRNNEQGERAGDWRRASTNHIVECLWLVNNFNQSHLLCLWLVKNIRKSLLWGRNWDIVLINPSKSLFQVSRRRCPCIRSSPIHISPTSTPSFGRTAPSKSWVSHAPSPSSSSSPLLLHQGIAHARTFSHHVLCHVGRGAAVKAVARTSFTLGTWYGAGRLGCQSKNKAISHNYIMIL